MSLAKLALPHFYDARAMSDLPPISTAQRTSWDVSFVPIVLQKSFSTTDQKFSGL
jgi:hypothetical protein